MSRVLTCLVALFLLPSASSARQIVAGGGDLSRGGASGQPPRDTQPATGRSTIRGRIVADDGEPLRRATVRINAPELRGMRTALTDADGRFEFRELPAGRYSIGASKPAFVFWSYGQTRPGSPGKPVVLGDNQTVDAIDIRLPRGAVITGRVTDEFGDPVPSASVMLGRQQFFQGQRRLLPAGGASANDIGEYRIFGLAPGQYYVSATAAPGSIGTVNGALTEGPEARTGYSPTFYPGTAEINSAQRVTVGAAQTLGEINIALVPTRLATVSGVATDSQGHPLTAGGVSIMRRGGMTGPGGGGQLRSDGTFTVPNVSPGEYVVRAMAPRFPPAPGTLAGPPEFSVAFVTVNGEDVTDVHLAPVVPATVSGRIVFDDPGAAQTLKPPAIRVAWQALNPDDMGIGGAGGPAPPVQEDLTFELKTAPGRIALRVIVTPSTPSTQSAWQVKAIRVNAVDVTDSGIDVGSQDVRGVEVELTNRSQQISGLVTDPKGDAVKDFVVVLFAQDRLRWIAAGNRYFSIGRPGGDGRFRVATLPPGDYYAIALDRADPMEWQDPEFLEGLSRQASAFSLAQGETKTLALRLFSLQ
jgi:protocatechuate 3,4-dioxygenase beta subunit